MSLLWSINGTPVSSLGLKVVSGVNIAHGVSNMTLERVSNFDAPQILSYGQEVTVTYWPPGASYPTQFFQGKVTKVPKQGSGNSEGQTYQIEDAWAEIEKTIYMEPWAIGGGAVLFPKLIFGTDALGNRITIGTLISNVITYAISVGINLQLGSVPAGELPIPTEISNCTCAEVIAHCLKLHPDWIPWIDHSTNPPTYNVTPVSADAVTSFALDGSQNVASFSATRRDDMLPSSVRIVYEWATTIDSLVYRNAKIDKYPLSGPDAGPQVIQALIPLEGMRMQLQKTRLQTVPIPKSASEAKSWIIARSPQLQEIDPSHFDVVNWSTSVVDDNYAIPDPISNQAPTLSAMSVADIPNELVNGSIEDWMRLTTGKVKAQFQLAPNAAASADDLKAISTAVQYWTGICTDGVTKIYTGVSSWTAADQIPTGIAESVYNAIVASMTYEGHVTLKSYDPPTNTFIGSTLNFTKGCVEWETMKAPIHSVSWNVDTGEVRIGFGPMPHLAPVDFLELQRILRWRPVVWWSGQERTSNQHGATNNPSSRGDSVGAYNHPHSSITTPYVPDQTAWNARYANGKVSFDNMELYSYLGSDPVDITGQYQEDGKNKAVKNGDSVWLHVTFDSETGLSIAAVEIVADAINHDPIVMNSDTPPLQTDAYCELGACDNGNWIVYTTTPLCLFSMVQDGNYAKYPLPMC